MLQPRRCRRRYCRAGRLLTAVACRPACSSRAAWQRRPSTARAVLHVPRPRLAACAWNCAAPLQYACLCASQQPASGQPCPGPRLGWPPRASPSYYRPATTHSIACSLPACPDRPRAYVRLGLSSFASSSPLPVPSPRAVQMQWDLSWICKCSATPYMQLIQQLTDRHIVCIISQISAACERNERLHIWSELN